VVDDGFKLVESLAILDYLEAKHPTPELLPTNARDLAFLEGRLDDRPYFGSNLLTLAELVAGTSVPQLPSLGVAVDNYPKLSAWCQRLIERHSWQKTQPSSEEIEAFIPRMKALMAAEQV
jgi:glutathione S-transferase